MTNAIEATILTGKFKGQNVLLPRIPTIPNDTPFRLAFAMTINKSQGQSMEICGLANATQYKHIASSIDYNIHINQSDLICLYCFVCILNKVLYAKQSLTFEIQSI